MPTASRTRRTSPAWTSSFSCIISAMRSSSPFYISVASVFVAIFCVSLSLGAASAAEEKPDHVGGGTQQDSHHTGRQPPNLLYILSDDMRSDLGYLGAPAVTPNLDALAKKSLVFTQAFTQLSVCAPSRMSFMSSLRPDTSKVWNVSHYARLRPVQLRCMRFACLRTPAVHRHDTRGCSELARLAARPRLSNVRLGEALAPGRWGVERRPCVDVDVGWGLAVLPVSERPLPARRRRRRTLHPARL